MRDIEVAFDISPTTYLTDELAVDLSKKALIKATGRAEDSFSPEYFHSKKEGYFARNANYPDHGYVLWFDKNSDSKSSLYHYSVSLERRGNMIIASVGKAK
jgi:hypothetical protein